MIRRWLTTEVRKCERILRARLCNPTAFNGQPPTGQSQNQQVHEMKKTEMFISFDPDGWVTLKAQGKQLVRKMGKYSCVPPPLFSWSSDRLTSLLIFQIFYTSSTTKPLVPDTSLLLAVRLLITLTHCPSCFPKCQGNTHTHRGPAQPMTNKMLT